MAIKYAIPAAAFDCQSICDALCKQPLIVVEDGAGGYCCVSNPRDFTLACARLGKTAFMPAKIASDNSPDAIEGYYVDAVSAVCRYALGRDSYAVLGELHQTLSEKLYHRVFSRKYSRSAFARLLGVASDTIYRVIRRAKAGNVNAPDDDGKPGLDYSKLSGQHKE